MKAVISASMSPGTNGSERCGPEISINGLPEKFKKIFGVEKKNGYGRKGAGARGSCEGGKEEGGTYLEAGGRRGEGGR